MFLQGKLENEDGLERLGIYISDEDIGSC